MGISDSARLRLPRVVGLSLLAFAFLVIWLTGAFDVASDDALFTADASSRALNSLDVSGPPAARERLVHVNWSALSPNTTQFKLNLFDDTVVTAVRERIDRSVIDGYVWVGYVAENPLQQVTISVSGQAVVGAVSIGGLETYTIRPLSVEQTVHLVRQIDHDAVLEPNGVDHVVPPLVTASLAQEQQAQTSCEDGSVVDLMIVYTAAAREAQGGKQGIEALINQRYSDMVSANQGSDVSFTWRLVEVMETDYVQSSSIGTDLLRLQDKRDGFLDEVHAARDAAKADLVALLVAEGNQNACGFAYKMNVLQPYYEQFAFGVTALDYADPYSCNPLTLAHEFGHNVGNAHDHDNASGAGLFPYSYGFQSPARSFRTIMAYDCSGGGCPRINRWSNPRVTYQGETTGIDYASNPNQAADIARSMSEAAKTVANFRATCAVATATPTPTIPPAETPATLTSTPTATAVASATPTAMPSMTATATPPASATATQTVSPTTTSPPPTATSTPTATATSTRAPTITPTATINTILPSATPLRNATPIVPGETTYWMFAAVVVGR